MVLQGTGDELGHGGQLSFERGDQFAAGLLEHSVLFSDPLRGPFETRFRGIRTDALVQAGQKPAPRDSAFHRRRVCALRQDGLQLLDPTG